MFREIHSSMFLMFFFMMYGIVMQESMHFLFKLQSVSLEKHLNGFAVVHLLSVRPTSVREHPLWDDRREREREREIKPKQLNEECFTFLLINIHLMLLLSSQWQVKTSAARVCGCIVCIQTSTYRACVCVCFREAVFSQGGVWSGSFLTGMRISGVPCDPASSEHRASTPLLLP